MSFPAPAAGTKPTKEVQVRVEIVKLNGGSDGPETAVEDVQLDVDATYLDLTNMRATRLPDLSVMRQLQRLTFRQNWLTSFDYVASGCPHLTELDLYENKLTDLRECVFPPDLVLLDLSFNELKHIVPLAHLKHLRELFLINNRLKRIEHLEGMPRLRQLELGSNSLRTIEGLDDLVNLEELWLGRNKIDKIANIAHLTKLKKLSIQSNRLTEIGEGLAMNVQMEELYLSHNGLSSALGLATLIKLTTLDLAGNRLTTLVGVGLEALSQLQELWLNTNQLATWADVEPVLIALKGSLQTVYLEHNPVQKLQDQEAYVAKMRAIVPTLQQLDHKLF